jgi:hypothetical protein
MRRSLFLALLGLPCLLIASIQAQKDDKPKPTGPLAGLPSKPGQHVARIEALGDDAWLDLGSAKADPRWGKARGRSWSSRMPYAPDLRGAFLFGEGVSRSRRWCTATRW